MLSLACYTLPDGGVDASAIRKKGISYSSKWQGSSGSGFWYRINAKPQRHLRDKTVSGILGITEHEVCLIASGWDLLCRNKRGIAPPSIKYHSRGERSR